MISALVPLLLEAALRALLAAIAVWAGLRLLRVGNVLVQKAAWGLVLVAALAMPLMPHWQVLPATAALRLPALGSSQIPEAKSAGSGAAIAEPAVAVPAVAEIAVAEHSASMSHSVATPQGIAGVPDRYPAPSISNADLNPAAGSAIELAPSSTERAPIYMSSARTTNPAPFRLAAVGWVAYLGVSAALLLRLLFGLASAVRLWVTAEPVSTLRESDRASDVRLRSSTRVAAPVNIGSGIVLPADYSEWDEEKLRIVLAHERSHIRQGDFYLQLLAGLYASLFWFSPLGWWLKRKLSELGEAISDRAGLEEAASRSSYAQLLLEFAALPRPTLAGVAMARTSHLAQRIERLLNESSFRQAFAAGGRRALLAVLLVPATLLTAAALIRVEAAASPTPAALAQPTVQAAGQSTAEQVTEPVPAPAAAQAPEAAPQSAPASDAMPAPPPSPPVGAADSGRAPMAPVAPNPAIGSAPPAPPAMAPMAPMPQISVRIPRDAIRVRIDPAITAEIGAARAEAYSFRGMHFSFGGDPYALVGDPGSKPRFNGEWDGDRSEEIEKARKVAHGHFLWFRHDVKSYFIDDPAIVSQVEAMNKPMDELGDQMRALGKQMRELGEQQRDLGKQMRDVAVPTPDLSKQMAELNAAVASLQAKQGGTISQKDLGDLQREIGRIQGELGSLQGKIGAQQGSIGGEMGKFGEQQGKLGGEMGKLGAQMGQIARENEGKVKKIIDESLGNGNARPVE
jgi:beta-lactamase regulating signal transducer with metallopeptidase domain